MTTVITYQVWSYSTRNPLEVLVDEYTTPVQSQVFNIKFLIPRFVDIDGDGDLDVFIGKGGYYDYNDVKLTQNVVCLCILCIQISNM